tara:strand:+ start:264 stop:599 length:336 start_codon:yes stop_codon:yes gene_type:complete
MKKLIFIFLVLVGSLAFGQEDVPFEMLGVWVNGEGEALQISKDDDQTSFIRRTTTTILASGAIEVVEGRLHVIRNDKKDDYNLAFFIGLETMVITKPRNKQRAWIWYKVGY